MESMEYVEARATRAMRDLPRFGHSNTFALLVGTKDQRSDYIYGLLFGGVLIISFFLVWTLLIGIFKCLGRKKVGFLSGSAFHVVHGSKKPKMIRIVFILSAMILVAFSALLVTEGLTQVKTGLDRVHVSSVEVDSIIAEGTTIVESIIAVTANIIPVREEILAYMDDSGFCEDANLTEAFTVNFEEKIQQSVRTLNELDDLYQEQVEALLVALEEAQEVNDEIEETVDVITPSSWQSLIFIVPFSVFCTLFVAGVLLAWFNRSCKWYTCFLSWAVLPLFFILIIVCYLLSGAIAIGASANADFCSGGEDNTPESSILAIMELKGHAEEGLLYRLTDFYINACDEFDGDPLSFIPELRNETVEVNATISDLELAINETSVTILDWVCGGNHQALVVLLRELADYIDALVASTEEALQLLACETIFPIYANAFWDGSCKYSIKGVTWTFAAFLIIATTGMVMITFRSSWLVVEYVDDAKHETEDDHEAEYEPYEPEPSLEAVYGDDSQNTGDTDLAESNQDSPRSVQA